MNNEAYDAALNALRSNWEHKVDLQGRERQKLRAIPGYKEALKNALPNGDATAAIAHLSQEIHEVIEGFAEEQQALHEQSQDVTKMFQRLDEADIRRMLAALSAEDGMLHVLIPTLSSSKNPAAATPLIEYLQQDFVTPPSLRTSRFHKWMLDFVFREPNFTDKVIKGQRWIDRMITMRALARLGDERAEAAITPFLNDRDQRLRKAAGAALRIYRRSRNGEATGSA